MLDVEYIYDIEDVRKNYTTKKIPPMIKSYTVSFFLNVSLKSLCKMGRKLFP